MQFSIKATTAFEAIAEVISYYEREGPRLHRLAGLTTARSRKDREAQALYAEQQAKFWREVVLESV